MTDSKSIPRLVEEYEKMRQLPEVWCAFRDYEVKILLKDFKHKRLASGITDGDIRPDCPSEVITK